MLNSNLSSLVYIVYQILMKANKTLYKSHLSHKRQTNVQHADIMGKYSRVQLKSTLHMHLFQSADLSYYWSAVISTVALRIMIAIRMIKMHHSLHTIHIVYLLY